MDPDPAVILSVKDGATLAFQPKSGRADPESFDFVLTTPVATMNGTGSTYFVGSPALFFKHLAESWRGWKGELIWATLEREFSMSASSDKLGHIALWLELRSSAEPAEWKFNYLMHLEAGSLDGIASNFERAFPIKFTEAAVIKPNQSTDPMP